MDTKNLADLYDLAPLDWAGVTAALDAGVPQAPHEGGPDRHTCWLTTVGADGAPHVAAVGAQWTDGAFWFETGRSTRKGRNLARDPRCVLAVALRDYDLTVEGTAALVTDPAAVARLSALWAGGGWPARPDETGQAITAEFSAPSAGPPPWHLYRIDPTTATALLTVEPGGATRWRF